MERIVEGEIVFYLCPWTMSERIHGRRRIRRSPSLSQDDAQDE
jgi:hypothetical protein